MTIQTASPVLFIPEDLDAIVSSPSTRLVTTNSSKDTQKKRYTYSKDVVRTRPLRPYSPFINYELLVWVVFITLTTLAIVDRFIWNKWPRQLFRIGAGTAGKDRLTGLKPGPWTVKLYDVVARISGRYSILSLNLLFFTMMRGLSAWLSETWLARRVVDFSNREAANRRIHKYNGILLVALMLVHVWSIILPCFISGWSAQVVPGNFEWPLSERAPPGFSDVDVVSRTMNLQVDGVFRILLMTVLLAVLIPISVSWITTRWHIGIQLHSLIAVIFFIDIVRRHTHPHSWILNTPFFVAWVLDHVVGLLWRRRQPKIFRQKLSDHYMVLFWLQDLTSNTVAPKYYVRHLDSSSAERSHVFTATENRVGAGLADGRPWTTCLVMRVYHRTRDYRLPKQDKESHTQRLAEATDLDVHTWGPFHGAMSERVRARLESGTQNVVLVGGGSAAGYILDGLQHHLVTGATNLTILYTARDVGLFTWVVKAVCAIRQKAAFRNVNIIVAVTDGGDKKFDSMLDEAVEKAHGQIADYAIRTDDGTIHVQKGRLLFKKWIEPKSMVYFEGSGGLQKAVSRACFEKNSSLVAGPSFDEDSRKKKGVPPELHMNCYAPPETTV